jgi:hypothetical protein
MKEGVANKYYEFLTTYKIRRGIQLYEIVHYRVTKSPPPAPIINQMNPIHNLPSYSLEIHFNTVLPPTPWSSKSSRQ